MEKELDQARIDEAVLALLAIYSFDGGRSWKGFDWDIMDRLHTRGLISQPRGKAKSIGLSEEGEALGRSIAAKLFAAESGSEV